MKTSNNEHRKLNWGNESVVSRPWSVAARTECAPYLIGVACDGHRHRAKTAATAYDANIVVSGGCADFPVKNGVFRAFFRT